MREVGCVRGSGWTYLWAFTLDLSWCYEEIGHQEEHILSLEGKAGGWLQLEGLEAEACFVCFLLLSVLGMRLEISGMLGQCSAAEVGAQPGSLDFVGLLLSPI